ncbi:MAG: tryptophan--tRNA ligase [Deltaproteobacteria bacterium]|nr:tryptophan--tRNA ligase [Deltaproteobacteria bacterium]
MTESPIKKRILSGMRPTGRLHLGNLHGALSNWQDLQHTYECYFFIADWHALTTEYKEPRTIHTYILDLVVDWISVGLDPEIATFFVQSAVPEHAELHLILSMITPLAWLERNPTYKEQQLELESKEIATYGFLGYPVLQAADIMMYKAHAVPVGIDQAPHVELTREIARRFNFLYGDFFPVPELLLTEIPKLAGLDGRKMSKSYDNSIFLADTVEDIRQKLSRMVTDPQRARRKDPGDPDVCVLFPFHKLYSDPEMIAEINRECRVAGLGCVDCKKRLTERVLSALEPVQAKRQYLTAHLEEVREILEAGNRKARTFAQETMAGVRQAIGF